MFKSFRGGIRFNAINNESKKHEIMRLDDVPQLHISLKQDTILCREQVQIGSRVRMYQVIAVPVESYGVVIRSPVSGFVADIKEMDHPLGGKIKTIIIENDFQFLEIKMDPVSDVSAMEPLDIIELVQRASIPGPTIYSRPEYMRLLKIRHRNSHTLVCNAAEGAPYHGHATRWLIEHTADIVSGLKLMMKAVSASRGIIAVTAGAKEPITAVKKELARRSGNLNIKIALIADKYPAADRMNQMFEDISLNFGDSATYAGITTPFACSSLELAARDGIPVTRIPVTVSGTGIASPRVIDAPIGTPIETLLNIGQMSDDASVVVLGGSMTGVSVSHHHYSLLRSTNSVLAFTETTEYARSEDCIHCGKCGSICPQGLSPSFIYDYVRSGNIKEAKRLGVEHCRLCGCCTYICPGRMELSQTMGEGKKMLKR